MHWNGKTIVDLSREFLNSNGADKHIRIETQKPEKIGRSIPADFAAGYAALASDLNVCSKRGLSERFDATIGAGTVLMPFGGKRQLTPIQAMVQKIPVEKGHTDDVSLMAFGFDPYLSEKSPYHGAYLAVFEAVSRLIASGADFKDVYLTFQEYFKHPGRDGSRWGQPFAALLGAFKAQMELGIGAIGGKDSMSGTFEGLDVPPTLVAFAVTTSKTGRIVSPELKKAGDRVLLFAPKTNENGLPDPASWIETANVVAALLKNGQGVACYTPGMGGIAEAIMKMGFGNGLGFTYSDDLSLSDLFGYAYASFLVEVLDPTVTGGREIGRVTDDGAITWRRERVSLDALLSDYEGKLESVFPCNIAQNGKTPINYSYEAKTRPAPAVKVARPRVLIPVFPGTNCEYDTAKAISDAGAEPEMMVLNNLTSDGVARSVERFAKTLKQSQIVFVPGGFSGGDEPDGSGKFITAFFRSPAIKEQVADLLDRRDGLMCGICNGFQALIKLGLVPYGKIIDTDENCPTLTFNTIGRHQSRIVRTRIASNKSPWLSLVSVGDVISVPISHGEGRFFCDDALIEKLAANGQIATQYVDLDGNATCDVHFNPNNSAAAIEGITSPDGRVFGKMGHSERVGAGLYQNVPGNYDLRLFEAAVRYFK